MCKARVLTDDKTIGATMSERSRPSDDVEEGIRLTHRSPNSHTESSLDDGGSLDGSAENGDFVDVALETSHRPQQPPGSTANDTPNPAVLCDGGIVD